MANPWKTSNDIIESVKRKISFPISQNTFSEEDILAFCNEEMFISQVPSVLEFHEEYFTDVYLVPLLSNLTIYEMPDRSIGMRLRDLYWTDASNNLFEMTRINEEDAAFFQRNIGANQAIEKYFLQGNSVVLTPSVGDNPTGSLYFRYFLRPNQLVKNDRAAIVQSFSQTLEVSDNTLISVGDVITVLGTNFTAVSGSPTSTDFLIGATATLTASNIVTAINTNGELGTASSVGAVVSLNFDELPPLSQIINSIMYSPLVNPFTTTNTVDAFDIPDTLMINFDAVPANITVDSLVDFLQTAVGHKIRDYDITVQDISSSTMFFTVTDVPPDLIVGDYVCSQNECIIPGIPTDLHNGLAERTANRMLASLGDAQGLAMSDAKIAQIDKSQGNLLDQRVEGHPKKIHNRNSLLTYGKMGIIRRF